MTVDGELPLFIVLVPWYILLVHQQRNGGLAKAQALSVQLLSFAERWFIFCGCFYGLFHHVLGAVNVLGAVCGTR